MVQLQQLCDKVPPFDSSIAMQTIRDDLKVSSVEEVYSAITPEPVAAASLGQARAGTTAAREAPSPDPLSKWDEWLHSLPSPKMG